jgi:hypothetical protein
MMYLVVSLGVCVYVCRIEDVSVHPNIKSRLHQPYVCVWIPVAVEYIKQGLII